MMLMPRISNDTIPVGGTGPVMDSIVDVSVALTSSTITVDSGSPTRMSLGCSKVKIEDMSRIRGGHINDNNTGDNDENNVTTKATAGVIKNISSSKPKVQATTKHVDSDPSKNAKLDIAKTKVKIVKNEESRSFKPPKKQSSSDAKTSSGTKSSKTSSTSTASSSRKRKVKFCKNVTCSYIEHCKELTPKDKARLWLTSEDLRRMEGESECLIAKMESGKGSTRTKSNPEESVRGLEKLFSQGTLEYYTLRHDTVYAVLKTQQTCRASKKNYDTAVVEIAKAYSSTCSTCTKDATERAQQDHDDIKEYYVNDPSSDINAVRLQQMKDMEGHMARKNGKASKSLFATPKLFQKKISSSDSIAASGELSCDDVGRSSLNNSTHSGKSSSNSVWGKLKWKAQE